MTLSDNFDHNSDVLRLINELMNGLIEASDFRLGINQFSTTKVRNLFRDSLPYFSSKLKDKFVNIFLRLKLKCSELFLKNIGPNEPTITPTITIDTAHNSTILYSLCVCY